MFGFLSSSITRVFNAVVMVGLAIGLTLFTVIIGTYNYDRSISDLKAKASNTAELAVISLAEPLWNYDDAGVDGILTAILLDQDVVGIRILKKGQPSGEKLREGAAKNFDELLRDPVNVVQSEKVLREEKEIAEVQIVTSTAKVQALIRYTSILISAFAVIFIVVLAVFIWLLGRRIVQRPINALRDSADHLARGELDYAIDTSRRDELGSLAVSFDRMRNAIRKKLADLATLNRTGEVMAGIHDQTEALRTAIKVMSEQTRVERGSIYLLDADKNLVLHAYFPEIEGAEHHYPKSFKLGEGIAGQVAAEAKTLFLPDTSKAAEYVKSGHDERAKALLCVPMMDDKEVFGIMNFVGAVGKVEFEKEDEGFALTIARMAVITTKNIQMLQVIEEHNRTLEQKVLERTAQLRQKTNDVNAMLQNMRQGIFTIVRGSVIHPEYSAYLAEIFETKEVAERPALGFLFDASNVGGDLLAQNVATVDALIGEDAMNFEFNSHLLVHEYLKSFPDGRSKVLELDWNPVLGGDDLIEKLMVTVRDVTELKALQLETEKQREQLEIIGQILAVSREKLLEFIETSYEFMDENRALIERTHDKDLDVVAALFRNMHTVKGNARTYGLTHVTDRVHEAETTYSLLRSDPEFAWDQGTLLRELDAARACVQRYESVFKEKLAGFVSSGVDPNFLEQLTLAIEAVNDSSAVDELKRSLGQVRNEINRLRYEAVGEMLKGIVAAVPSLARQLDKEVPEVVVQDNAIRLKKDVVPMLRNVFMHVFRNSLDHGIEAPAQRVGAGKPPYGRITLEVALGEDDLLFRFSDDGKGLALDYILRKAIENGIVPAERKAISDEEVAELIFLSGLSTAVAVTNVSGRGVGMDAIRQFLHKFHGDVRIVFTGETRESGCRPFELRITLPAQYAVVCP